MQYIGPLEAAEKHISTKIFKENLHTSVQILQICMDLQDSVNDLCRTQQKKFCRSAQIRKDRKPGFSKRFKIFQSINVETPFPQTRLRKQIIYFQRFQALFS